MNYGELAQRLLDYPASSEVSYVNSLNDFIIAAENKIFSSVSSPIYWNNETPYWLGTDVEEYTLPAGVTDILSIRLESSTSDPYLIRKDLEFLRAAYPDSTYRGTPKYYAVTSSNMVATGQTLNIRVAPIPDANQSTEITYRDKLNSRSITNGVTSGDLTSTNTTILSLMFPDVLTFGALTYAASFLKMPEMSAEYDKRFQEELGFFKNTAENRQKTDSFSDEGKQESMI